MKMRTKILLIIIPLLLVAIVILRITSIDPAAAGRQQPPNLVKVELPKREQMVQSLDLNGDILPIQQAQVFTRVYGNLQEVYVNIGDYVRENQLLALVDTTIPAQTYQQAAATYDNNKIVYERAKVLKDSSLISSQDFDAAETAMKVSKAAFDEAKTQLDYTRITAPFSGFITRRYLDPGATLSSTNATLFTLMDIDKIKVIVNVLEKDVPAVQIGKKAVLTVDAFPGRTFEGSIGRLSEALDLSTRTMPVEIDIPNTDHVLKPGMFARVSLIVGVRDNVLTVPTEALLKDGDSYYVFVADKNVARRTPVKIGDERQLRTQILSGLTENDSIITTGQQFTRDGCAITVQP